MKHLPNLLTLGNLFCGCAAIVSILHAQPFLYHTPAGNPAIEWGWAYGVEQIFYGGIFIFIAAVFDLLDGLTARALNVFSPIGKDLDSLADVVSFGVAPSMVLYQMLWDVAMREPKVTDVSMMTIAPAFAIALFAALRLARFNIIPPKKDSAFTGIPTPAIGLVIASFALMDWDNPGGLLNYLQHRWALYTLIALLCWLMISRLRFMKLIPSAYTLPLLWPRIALALGAVVLVILFRYEAGPLIFLLYILLSLFAPKPVIKQRDETVIVPS